jgi:hypothetical protein
VNSRKLTCFEVYYCSPLIIEGLNLEEKEEGYNVSLQRYFPFHIIAATFPSSISIYNLEVRFLFSHYFTAMLLLTQCTHLFSPLLCTARN